MSPHNRTEERGMAARVSGAVSWVSLHDLQQLPPQRRQCGAMLALKVEAFSAVGYRAHQHGLVRPEVITRIGAFEFHTKIALDRADVENRGSELADGPPMLVSDVAHHGQRLQVDF